MKTNLAEKKASNKKMPDYREEYYTGLAGIYFNRVLNKVINFGNLKKEKDVVLDFGCGTGNLKKRLKRFGVKVIGYDIIPENSDVKDYKTVKPSAIVCNHVLEHLASDQIEELAKCFLKTNAKLIVALPTENIVSRIGMLITGKLNYHNDHKIKYKKVNKILEKYYSIKKRAYVFTMTQVTSYYPKSK